MSWSSLILSYLSQQIALTIDSLEDCQVISPALIKVQEGMTNRILVMGDLNRNIVSNNLTESWRKILMNCQQWLEQRCS
jgi:CRISPR-associated protein Cmr2